MTSYAGYLGGMAPQPGGHGPPGWSTGLLSVKFDRTVCKNVLKKKSTQQQRNFDVKHILMRRKATIFIVSEIPLLFFVSNDSLLTTHTVYFWNVQIWFLSKRLRRKLCLSKCSKYNSISSLPTRYNKTWTTLKQCSTLQETTHIYENKKIDLPNKETNNTAQISYMLVRISSRTYTRNRQIMRCCTGDDL